MFLNVNKKGRNIEISLPVPKLHSWKKDIIPACAWVNYFEKIRIERTVYGDKYGSNLNNEGGVYKNSALTIALYYKNWRKFSCENFLSLRLKTNLLFRCHDLAIISCSQLSKVLSLCTCIDQFSELISVSWFAIKNSIFIGFFLQRATKSKPFYPPAAFCMEL